MSRYFQLIETAIVMLIIAIAIMPASATIINIPDDYPTIQEGIDASSDGDTVLVYPGEYNENINFYSKHIAVTSRYLFTGEEWYIDSTKIIGEAGRGPVVEVQNGGLYGFTVTCDSSTYWSQGVRCYGNHVPEIMYNIIEDNWAFAYNGIGIECYNSSAIIAFNVIRNNTSFCDWFASYGKGAGIYIDENSNPIVFGNVISENHIEVSASESSIGQGGGIYISEGSNAIIANNIITYNTVYCGYWGAANAKGGGIYCSSIGALFLNNVIFGNSVSVDYPANIAWGGGFYGNGTIINSIIFNNIAEVGTNVYGDPLISYSNIQDTLWPGEGNIDVDPLFRDPDNDDFHLMASYCGDPYDSPCIDAGHPDILDSLLDCNWGLGELRSDMGAYGGGDSVEVGIDDLKPELPRQFALYQNYPNPFNVSTTISYTLPCQSDVTIDIYDILGRKVQTLVSRHQQAGYHRVIWKADEFSSGIYFYKLQAGDYIETKKMMLLR